MSRLRVALAITFVVIAGALMWLLMFPVRESAGSDLSTEPRRNLDASSQRNASRLRRSLPAVDSRSIATSDARLAAEPRWAASVPLGRFRVGGRVVTHGDREPVPFASVRIGLVSAASLTRAMNGSAAADGTFAFTLPEGEYASVWIDVRTERESGARSLDVPGPFEGMRDLGDLELAEFNSLRFRVVSTDGTPIPGAVVHARPGGGRLEEAGPDGTGSIELRPKVATLRVAAFGFELSEVPVPVQEDSIVLRLQPAATLTVRVTTIAGDPSPDTLLIRLSSDESPFGLSALDPLWNAIGNTAPEKEVGGDLLFKASKALLSPVRPGVLVRIVAREWTSDVEAQLEVAVGPREARVVDLALRGSFGRLSGRVVGADDAPIEGAEVQVLKPEASRRTDENGEFDFGAIPAAVVDLRVSSKKHALWRRPDLGVSRDAAPLVIRLEEGVSVKVKLVDADGAPAKGASVYALDRFGVTDYDGQVVLEHLPPQSIGIETFFAGVFGKFEHHASNPSAFLHLAPLRR